MRGGGRTGVGATVIRAPLRIFIGRMKFKVTGFGSKRPPTIHLGTLISFFFGAPELLLSAVAVFFTLVTLRFLFDVFESYLPPTALLFLLMTLLWRRLDDTSLTDALDLR